MPPAIIALILSALEELISITPGLLEELRAIFANPSPTPADWEALRQKVTAKSYADYVPASALPGNVVVLPGVTTAADESKPTITQPGATNSTETAGQDQNSQDQDQTTPAAAAPEPAYLPDGSPNPKFQHL